MLQSCGKKKNKNRTVIAQKLTCRPKNYNEDQKISQHSYSHLGTKSIYWRKGISNTFLSRTPNAQEIRAIIGKCDCIKLRTSAQ
jgi:hypothetical protein